MINQLKLTLHFYSYAGNTLVRSWLQNIKNDVKELIKIEKEQEYKEKLELKKHSRDEKFEAGLSGGLYY